MLTDPQSTVVAVKKLRKTHVNLSRTVLMELKEVIQFINPQMAG